MRYEQLDLLDGGKEYNDFVEKFKPKKTTDDCYTPPLVYDAILRWAVNEYGLEGREVVRPFYPGGDFESYPYPQNCVVVDNPPFSILSRIIEFYNAHKIDYFLFAPGLTVLSTSGERCNAVITDSSITYENGAVVKTAFVTNMGEWKIHVSSELHEAVKSAMEEILNERRVVLPKYIYPNCVLTSALVEKNASRGQTLRIAKGDCHFIRAMDAQRSQRKAIFGAGFLLSERAAAEKAAAEKAAAEKAAAEKAAAEKAAAICWKLSDRELALIARMSQSHN